MRNWLLRENLFIGLAVLAASAALLGLGAPFMKTWFYSFAWWSTIVTLDGVNYRRRGISLLAGPSGDFFFTAFLSVAVWLVFELFNLRLRNWSYHGLPTAAVERWPGYFIAFATVIPAIRELAILFEGVLGRRPGRLARFRVTDGLLRVSFALGLALLALPAIWPSLFFPAVWLGFIFLLEPVNYRRGAPSLLRDVEKGSWKPVAGWMFAGLTAGLLWELFNFWAGSHWEYRIPHFDFARIFQMPILGYGGFIPFALEIFAMEAFFRSLYEKLRTRRSLSVLFCVGLLAFDMFAFYLIDLLTVAN
jgi:hypothetical protein